MTQIYFDSEYNKEAISTSCNYANNLVKQLIPMINDRNKFSKKLYSYSKYLLNKLRKSYHYGKDDEED